MRKVRQKHTYGCGPACVATIVGVDYFEVTRHIWWKSFKRGTGTRDIQYLLQQYGYYCPGRLLPLGKKDYRDIKQNAILKIPPFLGIGPDWHWVVWNANRKIIIDPDWWPEESYKPSSYLPIHKISDEWGLTCRTKDLISQIDFALEDKLT